MTDHPERDTLFLYLSDDPTIDPLERRQIAAHIEFCPECNAVLDEFRPLVSGLRDPHMWDFINRNDPDRENLRQLLLDDADLLDERSSIADDFYAELSAERFELWQQLLDRHPNQRTAALAARILKDVDREMNRLPKRALQLLSVVEYIAAALPDSQSTAVQGDLWKQRANAYRHLFRYDDSLRAADLAEQFYSRLSVDQFDVAQARVTAAITLFKMTEYKRALDKLDTAIPLLTAHGISVPLAKALTLQANIFVELGAIARGVGQYRTVLAMVEQLGDRVEEARVLANLGDCNLRLGNYAQAAIDAEHAMTRYNALNMEAESIRSEWTLDLAHLRLGDPDALDKLRTVADTFEALGMAGDAGFVRLDVTEELLHRGDWTAAASLARALVPLFQKAGVTLASVEAADYLRQAVETHEATTDLVQYVRDFITADDPKRTFSPPRPN